GSNDGEKGSFSQQNDRVRRGFHLATCVVISTALSQILLLSGRSAANAFRWAWGVDAAMSLGALEYGLVHGDRPIDGDRLDREKVPTGTVADVSRSPADALFIDCVHDFSSAVSAAEDDFQASGPRRRFVAGLPTHSKATRLTRERFGLLVSAS